MERVRGDCADAAIEGVVSTISEQPVIAPAAKNDVIAPHAMKFVGVVAAVEGVSLVGTGKTIGGYDFIGPRKRLHGDLPLQARCIDWRCANRHARL